MRVFSFLFPVSCSGQFGLLVTGRFFCGFVSTVRTTGLGQSFRCGSQTPRASGDKREEFFVLSFLFLVEGSLYYWLGAGDNCGEFLVFWFLFPVRGSLNYWLPEGFFGVW